MIQFHRILVLLVVMMLPACATPRNADTGPHPTWPPGDAARIIHRRDVTGSADLAAPGIFDRIGQFITGAKPVGMVRPNGIAIDGDILYVTDQELQGVHLLNLAGGKSRFFSRIGDKHFVSPVGVAVCDKGLIVADSALNEVVILTPRGETSGFIAPPHGFTRPTGIAYDAPRNRLYVVDTLAHQVCVFDANGAFLRTLGQAGTEPGMFNFPTHVAVDAQGRIYVTDSLNFRVQVFDTGGRFLFDIGEHGDATGHLGVPKGVAVDTLGHIYIVDSYFSTVQIFDAEGRFLLNFGTPGDQQGEFNVPTGMIIDAHNRIYVCDSFNHRVQVFAYVGGAYNDIAPAVDR